MIEINFHSLFAAIAMKIINIITITDNKQKAMELKTPRRIKVVSSN